MDWVGGNDKEFLDAILLLDGLIRLIVPILVVFVLSDQQTDRPTNQWTDIVTKSCANANENSSLHIEHTHKTYNIEHIVNNILRETTNFYGFGQIWRIFADFGLSILIIR